MVATFWGLKWASDDWIARITCFLGFVGVVVIMIIDGDELVSWVLD